MTLYSLLLALSMSAGTSFAADPSSTKESGCKTTMNVEFGAHYALEPTDTVTVSIGRHGDPLTIEHGPGASQELCLDSYGTVSPASGITTTVTRGDYSGLVDMQDTNGSASKRTFQVTTIMSQTRTETAEGELTLAQDAWTIDMTVSIEHHPRTVQMLLLTTMTEQSAPVDGTVSFGGEAVLTISGIVPEDGLLCSFTFQPAHRVPINFRTEVNNAYTSQGYTHDALWSGGMDFALRARLEAVAQPMSGFKAEAAERYLDTVDGVPANPEATFVVTPAGEAYGMTCSW